MKIISGHNTLMLYYPSSTQGGCSKRLIQVQPSLLWCLKFQILIILTHYFITHPTLILIYCFSYSFKYFFLSFFILHSLSLFHSVSISLLWRDKNGHPRADQPTNYKSWTTRSQPQHKISWTTTSKPCTNPIKPNYNTKYLQWSRSVGCMEIIKSI